MNMNKKMVIILSCCIFIIFLLVGYLVINDIVQAKIFNSEVEKLEEADLYKDDFSVEVKSSGKHGVVEKKIKSYLYNYSSGLREVSSIIKDDKLSNLLSIDNFKKDGKEFDDSILYIDNTKKEFNSKIDKLILKSDKKTIKNYIKKEKLDDYYVSLYETVMLDGNIYNKLNESKEKLVSSKEDFNIILDNSKKVIEFLKINKSKWVIKNNKILFKSTNLVTQYNNLISRVR